MHFEIAHEFDAPVDVLELAFLSPELGRLLERALHPTVASVETALHEVKDGELRRVLRFQASAPLPLFRGKNVSQDMLAWEMRGTYRLDARAFAWEVSPKPQYRRYFRSQGTCRLEAVPGGRSRRTVAGDLEVTLPVPLMRSLVERMALAEVRKTYDAEAETLRALATL